MSQEFWEVVFTHEDPVRVFYGAVPVVFRAVDRVTLTAAGDPGPAAPRVAPGVAALTHTVTVRTADLAAVGGLLRGVPGRLSLRTPGGPEYLMTRAVVTDVRPPRPPFGKTGEVDFLGLCVAVKAGGFGL